MTRPLHLAAAAAVLAAGAATAGVVAHAGPTGPTRIAVGEREFAITIAHRIPTGNVQFVIHNSGKYPHALAVRGPGVAGAKTHLIPPGKTGTLALTLRAGSYRIWCPVPGHAQQGMVATVVARGTAAPAPATTASTTATTPAATGGGGGYGSGYGG